MKKEEAKLFIKTPPEPKLVKLQKETLDRRSKKIWNFLDKHPGIHLARLIKEVDYDPANFRKYMKSKKKLPQGLLLKTETYLKNYGLNV